MWLLKSSLRRLTRAPTALRALTPEHVATVMFEANFVGIVAARSLHFQFYSWCAWLPRSHIPLPILGTDSGSPGP